jgi:hypothetical protein
MFGVFDYMKTWLITYGLGIGFSCMNVYSNAYIYIRKIAKKCYDENDSVRKYTDAVMNFLYIVRNRIQTYKTEPFYDVWFSIAYMQRDEYRDNYMNLNTKEFVYFPLLDYLCLSTVRRFIESDSPESVNSVKELFKIIYVRLNSLPFRAHCDYYTDYLILFKCPSKYICRIGTFDREFDPSKDSDDITLNRTKKPFLCVKYFHPKMEKKIYLDIDAGFFVENNELLSPMFVYRCLMYQKESYIYDSDYKIHILDNMMKTTSLDRTSYILITKYGYEIKPMS